jgi:hypothetical protein
VLLDRLDSDLVTLSPIPGKWVADDLSRETFVPARMSPGVPLYSWPVEWWRADEIGALPPLPIVTGGDDVEDVTIGGLDYRIHTFSASGDLTVDNGSVDVEYLIVGGGGGTLGKQYGDGTQWGGAGGGGVRDNIGSPLTVAAGVHSIVVGAGGVGGTDPTLTPADRAGGSSSAFGVVTLGGAGNRREPQSATTAFACGEGGPIAPSTGTRAGGGGTVGQGFAGGSSNHVAGTTISGGGGGGAGGVGGNATATNRGGAGGIGRLVDFDGTPTRYGGGGGGGALDAPPGVVGAGGAGGGGAGGSFTGVLVAAQNGTDGLGGGAGSGQDSRNGGSGLVRIRYRI